MRRSTAPGTRHCDAAPVAGGGLACRAPSSNGLRQPVRAGHRRRSCGALPNAGARHRRRRHGPLRQPAGRAVLRSSATALDRHAAVRPAARRQPDLRDPAAGRRQTGTSVSEEGVTLETPRIGTRFVTIRAALLADSEDAVVVSLHERSMARKIDRQLTHRNAARSVSAMAAMLAHEVKNPLSGIRGAAQLLEQDGVGAGPRADPPDHATKPTASVALVDRMEVFSDQRPLQRGPVNIHEVLEHVRKVAQNGFARHIRFVENYDPSLPPVLGHRDQLVQVFLNLVKNAAEAAPATNGEIVLDLLSARRAPRRARQRQPRGSAADGQRCRTTATASPRTSTAPVRPVRHDQAERHRPGSCIGGQDHRRPRRRHRIRQRTAPHGVPGHAAHSWRVAAVEDGQLRWPADMGQADDPCRRRRPRNPHGFQPGARSDWVTTCAPPATPPPCGAGSPTARATSSSPTW